MPTARGGRFGRSAGGGAAATRACGRCEVRGARATDVRLVTRVARAWAMWIQYGQRDFFPVRVSEDSPPPWCGGGHPGMRRVQPLYRRVMHAGGAGWVASWFWAMVEQWAMGVRKCCHCLDVGMFRPQA